MSVHRCEFPTGCSVTHGTKLIEVTNSLEQRVRYWCCKAHIAVMRDHPEIVQEILKKARQAWDVTESVRTPEEMVSHPAQVALVHHQEICDTCRAVRDWTSAEAQAKRIRGQEDITRVGQYIMDHCCPEGVRLNYQVGLVMKGLVK